MSEIETAEDFGATLIRHVDRADGRIRPDFIAVLIEADRNAVRVALIGEIRALANKYAEHRSLYGDALESAFDETQDKYTQPNPRSRAVADPTIEEDLAFLRQVLDATGLRSVPVALDRVAAALKDRDHLEEGAQMLASQLEWSIVAGKQPKQEVTTWLERQRTRKAPKP